MVREAIALRFGLFEPDMLAHQELTEMSRCTIIDVDGSNTEPHFEHYLKRLCEATFEKKIRRRL
jgi:hypothetical protein